MNYAEFCQTGIDLTNLSVDMKTPSEPYFCTPEGAQIFGRAGVDGIHYCFLPGFGETVFAVSPMNGEGTRIHPIAADFEDFLRLLLACGDAAALEQAWQWSEPQFQSFLDEIEPDETVMDALRSLGLAPMAHPWAYLKALREQLAARLPSEVTEEDAPCACQDWRVFYGRNFWSTRGLGTPGAELPLGHRFHWGDADWQALSAYVCAKGLVLDLAKHVPAADVHRFVEKWTPLEEAGLTPEQAEQALQESPFHDSFHAKLLVNGRALRGEGGSGFAWRPDEKPDSVEQAVLAHYALDPAEHWQLWRLHFPWKRRTELRSLLTSSGRSSLTLVADPVWLPGLRFTAQPGQTVSFTHPATGTNHTLTVLALTPETLDVSGLPGFQEYPAHCLRLDYAVSPELPPDELQLRDTAPTDPPRLKIPDDVTGAVSVNGAACIGIIGGEDGPTSIFVSADTPSEGRAAWSSLHFAPPEQVTWQLRFSFVPRGEISEKLR